MIDTCSVKITQFEKNKIGSIGELYIQLRNLKTKLHSRN